MSHRALDLLAARPDKTCALGTASSSGAPAAALSYYVVLGDGSLLLSTHTSSRKWASLRENARVGLVAGWTFGEPHVQLDGRVELVSPGHAGFEKWAAAYYAALPDTAAFRAPDTAFVIVRPTWSRVTIFRPDGPPSVEEGPMD